MPSGPTLFELELSAVFALKKRTERHGTASLLLWSALTLLRSLRYRRPESRWGPWSLGQAPIQGPSPPWGPHPGLCRERSPFLFPVCFSAFPCLSVSCFFQRSRTRVWTTFSHLFQSDDERGWLREHLLAQAALTQRHLCCGRTLGWGVGVRVCWHPSGTRDQSWFLPQTHPKWKGKGKGASHNHLSLGRGGGGLGLGGSERERECSFSAGAINPEGLPRGGGIGAGS